MGRKTTTSGPSSASGSKRAKTASTSTPASGVPSNRALAAPGNQPPSPHSINKYELRFSNSKHIVTYDSIATRRIIEPKYMDIEFLTSVGLWHNLRELIEAAGWTDFLRFTFSIYERLCWECLSSLVVDWNAHYQDHPVYIKFLQSGF